MPTPEEYRQAMEQADGNRAEAARRLGVDYMSVYDACKRHGIPYVNARRTKEAEITVACEQCGCEIPRRSGSGKPYEAARHQRRRFCSRTCFAEHRRGAPQALPGTGATVTLVCAGCGDQFERGASRARGVREHYCSMKCRERRETKPCSHCGKPVTRRTTKLRTKTGQIACSRACLGALNHQRYGPAGPGQ
jgi:hypothetical protein